VAERTVEWVETRLALPDGLWGGSQAADPEYYGLDREGRAERAAPYVDPVIYTDANAAWIRALAEAGGRLGRQEWIERAAAALEVLLDTMAAPGGLLYHFRAPTGEPAVVGLLTDLVEVGRACVALAAATGRESFLDDARALVSEMEAALWADDGGFLDHPPARKSAGTLRYRERPFERNAAAARLYLDLMLATGAHGYRAIAERILALLSPAAGRYGVGGAEFALAVDEFFDPPPRIVIVGPAADAAPLRTAALALATPNRRVWPMVAGGRVGAVSFPASTTPVAYVCVDSTRSRPIAEPAYLAETLKVGR
jgi:uncharacterized protein YyaL (SSP411 family)